MADQESQSTLRDVLEEKFNDAAAVETPEIQETPQEKADRVRDEKGRFTEKSEKVEKVDKPEKVVKTVTPDVIPEVVDAPQPIPRPSSWKKEMWPIWDKLNTGAQLTPQETRQIAEYNSQREQQFATGVSTYKQEAERAKPIMEALAPYQAEIQQAGALAPQLVGNLLGAHRTLLKGSPGEKLNFFAKIAQDYGIPLQALYDQNVQQQYLASAPPQQMPQQPQPDINSLVESALEMREMKHSIETMAQDTQNYPFFHYLRSTMAQLLERGEATDLEDAYRKSLDAPEHSMLTGLQLQQQSQEVEQRKLEALKTTARVAKANVVSTRSATPATSGTSTSKPSVRDALVEAMASHVTGARV